MTDLTPEVWEKIRYVREYELNLHLTGPAHHFWNLEGSATYDPEKDAAFIAEQEARIARIKELEEAFFNRYIDADGVSIIGNEMTHDKYFVIARDIFLMMTSKVPRLREPYRDYFYLCIVGGREEDHRSVFSTDSFLTQAFPSVKYQQDINQGWSARNTCNTRRVCCGRLHLTESGLRKITGWCVSCVFDGHPSIVFRTYVHEITHAFEQMQYEIDPTFEERLLLAHKNSNENDLWGNPTTVGEWWAAVTSYWFLNVSPEYATLKSLGSDELFVSHEAFVEYDPMTGELCRQWYPDISFANIADNY